MNSKWFGWGCLSLAALILMVFGYFAGGWMAVIIAAGIVAFIGLIVAGLVALSFY